MGGKIGKEREFPEASKARPLPEPAWLDQLHRPCHSQSAMRTTSWRIRQMILPVVRPHEWAAAESHCSEDLVSTCFFFPRYVELACLRNGSARHAYIDESL